MIPYVFRSELGNWQVYLHVGLAMTDLWCSNTPQQFWLCQPDLPEDIWQIAVNEAIPLLSLSSANGEAGSILSLTLGEGQFGPDHWQLGANKRIYYRIKPLLPRQVIDLLKSLNASFAQDRFPLGWPVEERYVEFQWEVARQLLIVSGQSSISYRRLWPKKEQFALVLTHDIESAEGQEFVREVADIEEELGFRSSFNFVPERYPLDILLMDELRERGFEIGVHGLKHDGKLFSSHEVFLHRAKLINKYVKEFNAVGFRAPLTHRNPEWLQELEIEYDLSFFDTDPYEPLPGGCMSIWPFILGRFVELPYTLVQDSTLYQVLGETTPRLWLEKVEFIERYSGMALLNSHPDYLKERNLLRIYKDFLNTMTLKENYWHALPREVARWWRTRIDSPKNSKTQPANYGQIVLKDDRISLQ